MRKNSIKLSNVTDEQKTWLEQTAKRQGVSMTVIIKQLIFREMEKEGNANG